MREKTNANGAGETAGGRGCERAEELVAYLYGESAAAEAADFRQHLAACEACGEELAALGVVREGLGAWREEVMRNAPPLDIREAVASAAMADTKTAKVVAPTTADADASGADARAAVPFRAHARRRSASAALREFFALSPAWLRVGAATAAVVFCALAALTLARAEVRWDSNGFALGAVGAGRVVERQTPAPAAVEGFTEEQVDALVRQRVEREVADARARWESENSRGASVVNAGGVRGTSSARDKNGAPAGQKTTRRSTHARAQGEQLADNEDVFYPDEESVPRLTDILGAVKSPGKSNEQR